MPGWEVISWVVTFSLPVALVATVLTWPENIGTITTRGWMAILYVGLVARYLCLLPLERRNEFERHRPHRAARPIAAVLRRADRSPPLPAKISNQPTLLFTAAVVITVAIGTRMQINTAG